MESDVEVKKMNAYEERVLVLEKGYLNKYIFTLNPYGDLRIRHNQTTTVIDVDVLREALRIFDA